MSLIKKAYHKLKSARQKSNRIYLTMIKNNILIFVVMVLFFVFSFCYFFIKISFIDEDEFYNKREAYYLASKIVKQDYKTIDADEILSIGGWVEILNDQYQLIHIVGEKKDDINKYSKDVLLNKIENNYHIYDFDESEEVYFYSIKPFNYNSTVYYCIVKLPRHSVNVDIMIENLNDEKLIIRMKHAARMVLLFTLIVFGSTLAYAVYKAKKFIRPLVEILEGIKKMAQGDYSFRMEFKAENEFSKIKDAFNKLVERVEIAEYERKQAELQKNQLMLDISHDIKTPATSIQGYARALVDGVVVDKEQIDKYLELIYNKTQRISQMTDNLHTLTKLNNSNYEIKKEKRDLCEFVRKVLSEFYHEIEEKQFDLNIDLPDNPVWYKFDSHEMHRALSNLIRNALIYNPDETKLLVELRHNDETIELCIANDGTSIPKELKSTIFDEFVRGDKSRKSTGGTGLGLSITKKIIKKHNGTIILTEKNGYCTAFVINLTKKCN